MAGKSLGKVGMGLGPGVETPSGGVHALDGFVKGKLGKESALVLEAFATARACAGDAIVPRSHINRLA